MSAGVLQTQLIKRWPEALLGKLDLVFPNGPYLAQGKSDIEDFYDPPFYEWFQYSQDYQEVFNFDNCVAYIEDYMIKHGPFDGLMGFSQGLALTKVPKIKYVILMSGGKFGGSVSKFACPKLAANAFSSPVQCPSLHIIGETDYLKESGIELLDSFVDPVVINHPRGHIVAKLDEKGQKTMLSFIEKIEKIRTKNKVHDPKTESLASDENELPTNNTSSNFAFSTGAISPSPHRAVRFDKRRYGGRRGWKDGKICLALKDLRVAVPEKIGSGLQAILQGVTGEVSTITGQPDSGKSTLLDVLAWRFGLNTRQTGEMVINDRQQSLSGDATSVIGRKERGEEIGNDGKGEVQVQILKKPRFLCLHGFRTSSKILQKQLQRWPEAVLEKFDLVFIDAPYKAQGRSMVEGFYDPPYYEWFQFTEDYSEVYNFEECVDYIEDFMVKHGPFDGLMGFSQGGILSAALPGMQSDGVAFTKVPKIKYLIIMSGGKLGGTGSKFCIPKLAANAFSTPVQCPSLHIIGEADYFKESGIELLDAFVDPLVILHQKGHTIARLDEKGLKTMLSFIEKIEKIEKNEEM
ncbi:hypothetical protein RHSIM_RhsimUnG0200700 [Rhododendron simsii]|uniref:Serine hydrolase domain-containing protein n=1 Tax=Rhododendron simsii TaxID=118357 RepID=A0A834FTJ8_RHOSS|nr:hypothetical protein RHSIM_RhsimUnG0200700 [Rhododendron simsii]